VVGYTLRAPQAEDYAAIASWVPDAAACLRWAGPRMSFPFVTTDLPTLLTMESSHSYSLAQGDVVAVGFGQHWINRPGAVHVGRILVSPQVRGQGLGRVLVEQLLARALQVSGVDTVTLRVYRDNEAALALYASLGFVPVPAESNAEMFFMQR
jgi:ribosomal-protein-alanine N-acetyltransferase